MDVAAFLDRVRHRDFYGEQIRHVEVLAERAGEFAEPQRPLHDEVASLLAARGIAQLYSHQVTALELARAGRNFVVVTGTASGKTLCYHLPVIEACVADPSARALYLYPTKALAQDQMKGLLELLGNAPSPSSSSRRTPPASRLQPAVLPGVYDGDTPPAQRRRIKAEAHIVLSNPDMLHASILPYHPKWSRFFAGLAYVVIDEAHTYRGILGAHVACVLRRLARVCRHYGSQPVFIATSATIGNPGELVARLIGREAAVIDRDGSPRGRKYFVLWNPSPVGQDRLAQRSATDDAVELLVEAVEADAQALAFTRTRQATELIHRYAQDALAARRSRHADKIRAYRGGYLPNERREIEGALFAGELRGVAATNALELGVDVGSLDVALLVGYPGTIASCWQQAGRSGRRQEESLAVLLAGNDPIDHYMLRHPDYFFAQSPEQAVVDPENPYVLARHLKAAAFELPLSREDAAVFGTHAPHIADVMRDACELNEVAGRFYYAGGENPAQKISLRHMSDNTFSIVLYEQHGPAARGQGTTVREQGTGDRGQKIRAQDTSAVGRTFLSGAPPIQSPKSKIQNSYAVIANVDSISAPELVYPQAVYLHNGDTYLVRSLDLDGKVAYVERRETDYYTQAVLESSVRLAAPRRTKVHAAHAEAGFGEADVTWQTVAFKKIKFGTRENLGLGPVDIPPQQLSTTALWLTPDDVLAERMKQAAHRTSEGLVGLRNLAVMALPIVSMCDPRDISGVVDSMNRGRSTLVVYDRYPGGLGYCERAYERLDELLALCWDMIRGCTCDDGCPSCIGLPNLRPAIHSDPDLFRGYPIPSKQATLDLLKLLVGLADEVSPPEPRACSRTTSINASNG